MQRNSALACLSLSFVFVTSTAKAQFGPTLADLFQSPSLSITADDKLFNNFRLVQQSIVGAGFIDLTMIVVSPLADDPLNPGLLFTAPLGALGTDFGHATPASVGLVFDFDVQTTSGLPLIKDNSLRVSDWNIDAGPAALINISESVLDAAGGQLGTKEVQVRSGEFPATPDPNPNHFDSITFAPTSFLHVIKRIEILGPGPNDGAFLQEFEQRFSQIPEPTSLALCLLAAVCLPIRRHSGRILRH